MKESGVSFGRSPRRFWYLGARVVFGIFFLTTSIYCLLAYIPFTYQWVINCTLVTWLPVFADFHRFIYWGVVAALVLTLGPELRSRKTRLLTAAVSFSTVITPSLYRLLGHSPIVRNPMLGRPLFTATENERLRYVRESYLVTSSYGAVYGILKDNGRCLYIADAVIQKNYFFDLKNPRISSVTIDDPIRAMYESFIRDQVMTVNRFFQIGQDRGDE